VKKTVTKGEPQRDWLLRQQLKPVRTFLRAALLLNAVYGSGVQKSVQLPDSSAILLSNDANDLRAKWDIEMKKLTESHRVEFRLRLCLSGNRYASISLCLDSIHTYQQRTHTKKK